MDFFPGLIIFFLGRAYVEIACSRVQSLAFPPLAFLLFSFNIAQVSIVIIILP